MEKNIVGPLWLFLGQKWKNKYSSGRKITILSTRGLIEKHQNLAYCLISNWRISISTRLFAALILWDLVDCGRYITTINYEKI